MANGLTGSLLEWEVLGKPLGSVQKYMPYKAAMALARSLSPAVPTMPQGKKLYSQVCAALGVEAGLRMHSALGTPLDRFHGIDGWFEFKGRTVTFDLTCNGKKDRYKADLIIHEDELDDEGSLQRLAAHIARRLKG